MAGFNAQQVAQLLRPINTNRVLRDGKGHSHVSQQDVTAHLVRVLGFGNFDTEILHLECLFEHSRLNDQGKPNGRWDIGYRCTMRLTVKDEHGQPVAHYEDGATATAQNQTLGDGHDLALKSAISYAKKRCAINLGDQFGLSLYNKGQTDPLVRGTLVRPVNPEQVEDRDLAGPPKDLQDGVPQQLSLGHDEADVDLNGDNQ